MHYITKIKQILSCKDNNGWDKLGNKIPYKTNKYDDLYVLLGMIVPCLVFILLSTLIMWFSTTNMGM